MEETAETVRAAGATPLLQVHDLRQPDAAGAVVATTIDHFGRIDAVACIAGAVPQADMFALTDEQWDDGLALKFHSARRLTLAAWDALKATQGSVAITSGTSAYTPKASLAAVGTINAAILALAKAFADRGIEDGVQVNTVLPGSVMTDRRLTMLRGYADKHGLSLDGPSIGSRSRRGSPATGSPKTSPTRSPSSFRPKAIGSPARRSGSTAAKPRCFDLADDCRTVRPRPRGLADIPKRLAGGGRQRAFSISEAFFLRVRRQQTWQP